MTSPAKPTARPAKPMAEMLFRWRTASAEEKLNAPLSALAHARTGQCLELTILKPAQAPVYAELVVDWLIDWSRSNDPSRRFRVVPRADLRCVRVWRVA